MSAEVLRRAAALMRERAEVATPGPWEHDGGWTITATPPDEDWIGPYIVLSADHARNDGEHAASWHPAVALAVAAWLDAEALRWERVAEFDRAYGDKPDHAILAARASDARYALAIARAYLGDDA